ncbi:hypothetical protein ABZ412_05420 [Nocardia sp. NPDC005746]|uniref:hypothetical protein n=1 Tax=Nocardia sp. NPDC005746 TaxID=3157062 RepID=UPI0033F28954
MEYNGTVRSYLRGLHQLRPARRLVLVESAVGLLVGVATLPQSYPSDGESAMWAQLLGLSFLLANLGANLRVWHRVVATGVRLRYHRAALSGGQQLRQFILDERRLRIATIVYVAAICLLVPLPPSWRWLWFTLTLLTTVLTAASLWRMWRAEVCGTNGGD